MIHDESASIERISGSTSSSDNVEDFPAQRLPGSSSVSCLGDDTVVTTCALVDEPTVLSVSLIQGVSVELDLGQTQVFGIPVKIQCFAEGSSLLLRLVDTRGIVLSIILDTALTPETLSLLSIPHMVESEQGYFSGAELDSSMVSFLSSTVLLLGLAPDLLAVNLATRSIDIWSQAQTLEEMKSKSLFSRASDLLLGRPEDDIIVDMPPTAALCHASGEFVFSLHSDASIRRWRIDDLHPIEVVPLKLAQDAISEPETWSDSKGAVAMSAQLYQSVYTLAIHVQTVGGEKDKSPCQLIVVYGSQDAEEGGDLVRSTLHLSVPKTATSLVGLDLARERCRLTALFRSQENDSNNTLFVTYPPSVMSIVSTEPIVTPRENSLDGVAASERARLSGLAFPVNGTSLEEDLHSTDTAFLKCLFRPAFPRGTGSVTPPSCLRAAIRKLVPGHYAGDDMSIELETLRAMHEWRRLDNRSIGSPARRTESATALVATPAGSVYDNYARQHLDGTPDNIDVDNSDMEGEVDLLDQERAVQVKLHEQRWRELLLAVWQEEERMRDPLCVSNLSTDTANFVLVRAGVTSLLRECAPVSESISKWEDLDRTAMTLLGLIENSEEGRAILNSIESQAYEEIAKASVVLSTEKIEGCANDLIQLGKKALVHADENEIYTEDLADTLRGASEEDTLEWLQSIDSLFSLGLPGASVLPDGADVLDEDSDKMWSNRIADVQLRLAASSLFVQCTDSIRRLTLARILLLSSVSGSSSDGSPIFQAAFREYLHSVSVLWTCAQQVPTPSAGLFGRNRSVEFGRQNLGSSPSDSPPTKRLSFGDTTSSILAGDGPGNAIMTTALDARFIQISQEHSQSLYETGSLDGPIIAMVRICVNSTFASAAVSVLPELGVLPVPSDDSAASDYPRLALRLIALFYVHPPRTEDEDVMLARKEALAECLFIEANAESQNGPSLDWLVNALQTKACDLLVPPSSDMTEPIDHNLLETVFLTLRKQSQTMPELELEEIDGSKKDLANEFQLLLNGIPGRPGTEITRLCQQPTPMSIFLPLMATEHRSFFRSLEELSHASVKSMAEVLLRISKMMHRLSILERHASSVGGLIRSESSGKSDFLLGHIEKTITDFQSLLPKSVYDSMAEYATLWTLLFNHSIASRRWRTAHSVCVNHPVPERRVENYKRLVVAMANAGAMSELIDLCTMVAYSEEVIGSLGEGGACIDLYEIAAEALAETRQGDPYENGLVSTDYLGCLYALHAFRGRWERAAQAMDAKYILALKAVSSRDARVTSIVNLTAAAKDVVLASLFTSNAMQAIEDPSKRFLVSGEVGPFPILPITSDAAKAVEADAFGAPTVRNKRGRTEQGGLIWTPPRRVDDVQAKEASDASRLSRFMTVADLNARAARAIALWIFLCDQTGGYTSDIFFSAIKSPSAEGDRVCIDHLVSIGYYHHAILLAKAFDDQCEERDGDSKPDRRSFLHDAIIHVLTYVLPVALNQTSNPLMDSTETDEERFRPTLSQLRRAIEETGDTPENPFSFVVGETWCPRATIPTIATASAAMELTRELTTEFTNSSLPIALEVADMFLDIDPSGASFPLWLERLLLGIKEEPAESSPGLFAQRANADCSSDKGNPGGLVSMYMKRGLFSNACDVVSAILTGSLLDGGEQSRETRAPSRLPEKGDIDFVPYAQIDVLWRLIDRALSNPMVNMTDKRKLEESRKIMETALEKHFDLMKISELGMRSARALKQ